MYIKLILLILMLAISINTTSATLTYAGIRDSIYGCPESDNCQTLHNSFYINVAKQMAAKFSGSIPTVIYIIGHLDAPETYTYLNFPSPGGTHNYVHFETIDGNEANLDAMDAQGLDYWLQVEPGDASMTDLMALVFGRYGANHAGHIIGFGIDAEWYRSTHATDGQAVSNSNVNSWISYVHNYDAYCVGGSCRLFLKHFDESHMPSTHPAGVLFLNDGQQNGNFATMKSEYKTWFDAFPNAMVGIQTGYPSDQNIWEGWGTGANPASVIYNNITAQSPSANFTDYYWVDFSANVVFNEVAILINGTVIDSVNKTGIPGVKVSTNTNLSTTTNATGFYSFAVTEGTYNLTATFDVTYYMNTITVSTVGKAFVVQNIEMIKKPTGKITGSVIRCCTII